MPERVRERVVVITGGGSITPLGKSLSETWSGLIDGRSGIGPLQNYERYDFSDSPVKIAGQIKNFDPLSYFKEKPLRRIHRVAQFSHATVLEAIQQADLWSNGQWTSVSPERVSFRIGTSVGGMTYIEDVVRAMLSGDRINPFSTLLYLPERVATVPGMESGVTGSVSATSSACATGGMSLNEAVRLIWADDADVVVAGGVEAPITPAAITTFNIIRALSTRNDEPERASRPFDKGADGFVMAEGSGLLVLESLEHALLRGAKIYGVLAGYGESSDAYGDTEPHPQGLGAQSAMRLALGKARRYGVTADDIGYINAHATSTPKGDQVESTAVVQVFGKRAGAIPVSASKSMLGHLLGASGGTEALVILKVIETGDIPPTINLEDPIRDDLDYVANTARRGQKIDVAMSNSFGFGGINTSTIIMRYLPELHNRFARFTKAQKKRLAELQRAA